MEESSDARDGARLNLAIVAALSEGTAGLASVEAALAQQRGADRFMYEMGQVLNVAAVYSLLGDVEGTLRHLGTCLHETRSTCSVASLRTDPWWDYLNADARLEAMLGQHQSN